MPAGTGREGYVLALPKRSPTIDQGLVPVLSVCSFFLGSCFFHQPNATPPDSPSLPSRAPCCPFVLHFPRALCSKPFVESTSHGEQHTTTRPDAFFAGEPLTAKQARARRFSACWRRARVRQTLRLTLEQVGGEEVLRRRRLQREDDDALLLQSQPNWYRTCLKTRGPSCCPN